MSVMLPVPGAEACVAAAAVLLLLLLLLPPPRWRAREDWAPEPRTCLFRPSPRLVLVH